MSDRGAPGARPPPRRPTWCLGGPAAGRPRTWRSLGRARMDWRRRRSFGASGSTCGSSAIRCPSGAPCPRERCSARSGPRPASPTTAARSHSTRTARRPVTASVDLSRWSASSSMETGCSSRWRLMWIVGRSCGWRPTAPPSDSCWRTVMSSGPAGSWWPAASLPSRAGRRSLWGLPPEYATHTSDHRAFSRFAG
jgi:hypothetical protein